MKNCSLYLHIPYCRSRCSYCDFHSSAIAVDERYLEALRSEIPQEQVFETVYVGGGTPSLLSSEQLKRLCKDLKVNTEFTLEGNPDSLSREWLDTAVSLGVNRLSIGVQSLNDKALKAVGRLHTSEQVGNAVLSARQAGIDNISLDLMVGIPYQNAEDISNFITFAQSNSVKHISCYMLKLEEDTPMFSHVASGEIILPSPDETAELFDFALGEFSRAGFERYEISNFAVEGFYSRHNMRYWDCENYLGIGAGAHSCIDNKRFYYAADTEGFIESRVRIDDGLCDAQDFIMLQTRLKKGLSVVELHDRFGYRFDDIRQKKISDLKRQGLLEPTDGRIVLTNRGMMLQNSVLSTLL